MGPENRPLDLEWLEDFLALAEHGNFSRAAQARAIAQPAFSRHIRSLEEWVGVELFDRTAHPAALTMAGERFHPLVKALLADLQAARIKTRAVHDLAAISLRIAATNALSLTVFPRWLSGMESQLRLGPVQTMSDSLQACEDLMLQRRVQFVLCHGHANAPGRLDEFHYPVLTLGRDVLVPVSIPASATSSKPLYRLSADMEAPILMYGEESGLGRILRTCLRDQLRLRTTATASAGFTAVFTAHYAVMLKTMALEGRGIAWLPESLIADELASGKLLHAGDAGWQVSIEIRLYRQHAEMTPVAESLWQLSQQSAAASVASHPRPSAAV